MAKATDLKLAAVRRAGKAALQKLKAEDAAYKLSTEGEGRLLGGSLVLAAESGEALFVHHEVVFGDVADPALRLEVCRREASTALPRL